MFTRGEDDRLGGSRQRLEPGAGAHRGRLMKRAEATNLHERCQVYAQLNQLGPEAKALVQRLDALTAEATMLEEDRILRIVGVRLAQEGLGELFEQLYAAALDGCQVDPGDARRFLQMELADP